MEGFPSETSPRLADITWMAFDLETTGFGGWTRPVEFGAQVFRLEPDYTPVALDAFALMVDPAIPISEGASKVHGITAEIIALGLEVGNAKMLDGEGWAEWSAFVGERPQAIGLAHNALDYDLPILRSETTRNKLAPGRLAHPPVIVDSLILARYLRGRNGNKLVDLAARYGIAPPLHRAHGDCLVLARVFAAMLREYSDRFVTFRDLEVTGAVVR